MEELWRYVLNYEGLYAASSNGRIKRVAGADSLGHKRKETILAQVEMDNGYLTVNLSKKGITKKHKVSRLVWEAFNGPIPEGMQVNHINEDKHDNRLENLNLMTPRDNRNWGTAVERSIRNRKGKTETKPVYQYTFQKQLVRKWDSLAQIQKETDYSISRISGCCNHKPHHKSSNGYIWTH